MQRPSFTESGPAACQSEADLFFPDPKDRSVETLRQVRAAKAICGRCPYKLECAEWAIQTPYEEGIWGGLTEAERRKARRKGLTISPSRRADVA
jgi:WhiB family redox-sensing transcriptional regulator